MKKVLDKNVWFVLAPEIPLLDEGPERADRHFSGAAGGAATGSVKVRDGVPQKGPSDRAIGLPDVARLHDPIRLTPAVGRKSGRVGECIPPRGALRGRHF